MIKPKFLEANARFYDEKNSLSSDGGRTVLDFWRWAYSDVFQNITRGYVAQFIVAWLVGADRLEPNNPFRPFDVQIPGGKRIEVKSTAWLQSWQVKKPNPMFVVKPSHSWDEEKGYGKEKTFNADIYALCYYFWRDEDTANIFNLNQWKFWVFTKEHLMKVLDNRQSIGVQRLENKLKLRSLDAVKLRDTLLSL